MFPTLVRVTKLRFAPLERGDFLKGRAFYKHLAPNGAKSNHVLLHLPGGGQRRSFALARSSHGRYGAYSEVAAARLFRCFLRSRVEKKLAHLARRIA